MAREDAKNKAREPVRDSEGTPVVTARAEEPQEEKSLNAAAKEAFEAERAADAAAAEEEAEKIRVYEKKLADRAASHK